MALSGPVAGPITGPTRQRSRRYLVLDGPGIERPAKPLIVMSTDTYRQYPAYEVGYDREDPPERMSTRVPGKPWLLLLVRPKAC